MVRTYIAARVYAGTARTFCADSVAYCNAKQGLFVQVAVTSVRALRPRDEMEAIGLKASLQITLQAMSSPSVWSSAGPLLLVAALWGCTNPLLNRASQLSGQLTAAPTAKDATSRFHSRRNVFVRLLLDTWRLISNWQVSSSLTPCPSTVTRSVLFCLSRPAVVLRAACVLCAVCGAIRRESVWLCSLPARVELERCESGRTAHQLAHIRLHCSD